MCDVGDGDGAEDESPKTFRLNKNKSDDNAQGDEEQTSSHLA